MSQILKNLQLVTQSYSGTPNVGTGALFASGNAIYFENSAGIIYPLGATADGGYIRVLEYTGSNPGGGTIDYTWHKPGNLKYLQVVCVGAGGGGGSGFVKNVTAGIAREGGGVGGGGGAISYGFFDASMLTQPSYTISVGGGGAGGLGSTVPIGGGVSGQNGSAGQYTTFGGTLVSASGGGGGPRNQAATPFIASASVGGRVEDCLPGPLFAIKGGNGSANGVSTQPARPLFFFTSSVEAGVVGTGAPGPTVGGAGIRVGTAAGGSGWNNNLDITISSGSLGASGVEWNILKPNNTVSGNSGSSNLVTAAVLLQTTNNIPITTTYGLGGGGNANVTPFDYTVGGGDGGLYGAGGGATGTFRGVTGVVGPSAGSGSSGLCILVEYY
jgi:hypothetical protein